MSYISGVFLLLFLELTSGIAWAEDEGNYKNELAFVQKTRSLAGTSTKYLREADRKKGKSIVETFTVRVWAADNGRVEDILQFPPQEEPTGIDGSLTDDCVAAIFWNLPTKGEKYGHSSVGCYSLIDHRWIWKDHWPSETDKARRVNFSSDGLKVIVTGYKNIVVYDAKSGKKLEALEEPLKDYPLLSMSVRGSVLGPSGRYIVIWQEPSLPGHRAMGKSIANKWVTVWDLLAKNQIAQWEKPNYESYWAVFTQDEKSILFGSAKRIRTWSIERREMIREWSLDAVVTFMKFSDDYRYLAVGLAGENLLIRVYDYSNQVQIRSFERVGGALGEPYPMTFFDGGRFFAFAKGKQVYVYETRTWEEKWRYPR